MVTTRRGTEIKSPAPPKKTEGKQRASSDAPKKAVTNSTDEGAEFTLSVILFMVAVLFIFVTYLGVLFYTLPHLEDDVRAAVIEAVKPPHKLEDAIILRDALSGYATDHGVMTSNLCEAPSLQLSEPYIAIQVVQ
eukprot:7733856-Pyramimonas_sp.AAC.2